MGNMCPVTWKDLVSSDTIDFARNFTDDTLKIRWRCSVHLLLLFRSVSSERIV